MGLQDQLLACLVIAYGGEIQSTIEELSQRAEHLHTAPELNWLFEQAFFLDVLPQVLVCDADSPKQVAERNTLLGSSLSKSDVPILDARLSFGCQPVGQV